MDRVHGLHVSDSLDDSDGRIGSGGGRSSDGVAHSHVDLSMFEVIGPHAEGLAANAANVRLFSRVKRGVHLTPKESERKNHFIKDVFEIRNPRIISIGNL